MPVFLAARNRFFYTNRQNGQAGRRYFIATVHYWRIHRSPNLWRPVMLMQSAPSSMRGSSKNAISVYLQLTLVGSAAVWILIIWSGHVNMGYGLVLPAI